MKLRFFRMVYLWVIHMAIGKSNKLNKSKKYNDSFEVRSFLNIIFYLSKLSTRKKICEQSNKWIIIIKDFMISYYIW